MNQQILWRMAWKEYRFMRTFWLALAVIALVLQALAAWSDSTMPAQGIFVLAAMLMACHALGCGGTAFAGEREAGTYRFLRSLPVTPTSVLWGKLAYAITATILLGVFLWFSGWVYCLIRNFSATSSHYVVLTSGLRTMELLLWAVMFSLLISRPLWSVVLAFVAAGLSGEFLAVLFAGHELDLSESALWQLLRFFLFPAVWWCHLILVIGLLAADIYLVRRWFREAMPIDTEDAARRSPQDATVFALIGRNTAWQRMIWHQVQTSRRMLVAAWVLYAVCVLLAQFISPSPRLANSLIEPLAALTGFYGVLVFYGDQHGREFRFFAEQGVSPRLIWWTRQAYWGAILLLSLGALVGLSAILHNFTSQSGGWYRTDYAEGLLVSLGVAVLAYGTGQFCSMSGQRMVLIAAVTAFLTFLSTGWCTAMIAMQVPFIWSVALVPILMLFASWFLVSDWILERSGWRGRLRMLAVTVVPLVLMCVAVATYRWTEIPHVAVPLSPQQLTDAEREAGLETAEMYLRAVPAHYAPELSRVRMSNEAGGSVNPNQLLTLPPDREDEQAFEALSPNIQEILAASKRPYFESLPNDNLETYAQYFNAVDWMSASARRLQKLGQLDESLEHLLAALKIIGQISDDPRPGLVFSVSHKEHRLLLDICYWANAPGQDAERIRKAMKQLDDLYGAMPGGERRFERGYSWAKRILGGEDEALEELIDYKVLRWVKRLFPWEVARTERLVEQLTTAGVNRFREIHSSLQQGKPLNMTQSGEDEANLRRWQRTTFLGAAAWYVGPGTGDEIVNIEMHRRATRITLALLAWRCEHGSLPDSLERLVGDYLERVPVEPYLGKPFLYFPDGLDEPIRWHSRGWAMCVFELPTGSPVLIAPMQGPIPAGATSSLITEPITGAPYPIPDDSSNEQQNEE